VDHHRNEFSEVSVEEYLQAMREDMDGALTALRANLGTVRTGRASPQLVEGVQINVTAYGANMPLKQLATISAPDARLLVVSPWDKSVIPDIEKGIASAGLGLNPSNDGQIIRIPIPALTGERRQELVRLARRHGEDAKVRVRGVRREYNEVFRGAESDKDISEDDLNRLLKQVQTATDTTARRAAEIVAAKEQEILEV
jgi:ribosome recycling factor